MRNAPTLIETLVDEAPAGPDATRRELFASAKRTMAPFRHSFVQKTDDHEDRTSTLGQLVRGRHGRGFDQYTMTVALNPILEGTPLRSAVWARLLSPESGPPVSAAGVSKTWDLLEELDLVKRGKRIDRLVNVAPLHESGSGAAYQTPGKDPKGTSKGYFYVPVSYWLDEWHVKLSLPAKAMLFIWLSATHRDPTFSMSYDKAPKWYGVSERTAERGIQELIANELMEVFRQRVSAGRAGNGFTYIHHRRLTGPYSSDARNEARKAMLRQTRRATARKATASKGVKK